MDPMMKALTRFVAKRYGFKSLRFVRDVKGGFLSHNFVLAAAGKKYFLKQYRFDEETAIRRIHAVKHFLAKAGIPVILPFETHGHSHFFRHGGRYYSLFPFVRGRHFLARTVTKKGLRSAASVLADIHLAGRNARPAGVLKPEKSWRKAAFLAQWNIIRRRILRRRKKDAFDRMALRVLGMKRDFVLANGTSYRSLGLRSDHLTHGDYHLQNIFFDDRDRVAWVFDLEKTEIAPRVLEVIRSMDLNCFDGHFKQGNFANARTYLRAYHARYPLRKKELENGLRAYVTKDAHGLWVEKEHYLRGNTRVDVFLRTDFRNWSHFSKHSGSFIAKIVAGLFS